MSVVNYYISVMYLIYFQKPNILPWNIKSKKLVPFHLFIIYFFTFLLSITSYINNKHYYCLIPDLNKLAKYSVIKITTQLTINFTFCLFYPKQNFINHSLFILNMNFDFDFIFIFIDRIKHFLYTISHNMFILFISFNDF